MGLMRSCDMHVILSQQNSGWCQVPRGQYAYFHSMGGFDETTPIIHGCFAQFTQKSSQINFDKKRFSGKYFLGSPSLKQAWREVASEGLFRI